MNESMMMMMGKETEEEKKQNQNQNHTKTTATWGTWEELLLACAVKRHGFKNWDLVAMEVQARSCLPQILTTPDVCQQKYHDLNRRFTTTPTATTIVPAATTTAPKEHTGEKRGDSYFNNNNNININNSNNNNNNEPVDNTTTTTTSSATTTSGGGGGGDGEQAANIPWLEELRKLRVAELKQEVHRYDASILSLQLEVKRLVEEREKSVSLQDNKIQIQIQTKPSEQQQQQRQQEQKPDLNDADDDRSDNNHKSDDHHHRFLLKPCISPDESDRENRSVNESNSTASEDKGGAVVKLLDVDAAQAASVQQATSPVTEIGRDESYEVDDSVTQLSSEAQSQSSASLGRKRKREERRNRARRKEVGGGGGGGDDFKGMLVPVESEPLIGLLDLIRAHRHGSFFESRHQAQESESYKSIVRQHMDLETLQAKLDQGFYTSHLPFHRDLHLLFNNAAVFFPKLSVESLAAQELQSLILPVLRKETIKSDTILEQPTPSIPTPHTAELEGSDSLLAKHNSPVPIAVSRKRSSMSAKPSTSSSLGQKNEQQQHQGKEDKAVSAQKPPVVEQASLNMKSKEKPVTGVRSSRRSNKNFAKVTNTPGKRQSTTSPVMKDGKVDKAESSKSERKKIEPSATDKKRSAANFLKRIKKNSPGETLKKNNKRGGDGSGESKRDNGGKGDRGKETVLRKNSNRRQVKEESSPVRRTTAGPSKKVTEVSKGSSKRVREGGRKETEDVAKKPRKRSRR